MSTGHMAVQAVSYYIGRARATGVYGVKCTWLVTHMGFGKRYWYGGHVPRAALAERTQA